MKTLRHALPVLMISACITHLSLAQTPPPPNPQMKAVLDQLGALHPKPIVKLTPQEARKQPSPADAVAALLKKQGKSADP